MGIRRAVPNLLSHDLDASRDFEAVHADAQRRGLSIFYG